MQVGSVDFKVNLDLDDLDKQLAALQSRLEKSQVQLKAGSQKPNESENKNKTSAPCIDLQFCENSVLEEVKKINSIFNKNIDCIPLKVCEESIAKESEKINSIFKEQVKELKINIPSGANTAVNNATNSPQEKTNVQTANNTEQAVENALNKVLKSELTAVTQVLSTIAKNTRKRRPFSAGMIASTLTTAAISSMTRIAIEQAMKKVNDTDTFNKISKSIADLIDRKFPSKDTREGNSSNQKFEHISTSLKDINDKITDSSALVANTITTEDVENLFDVLRDRTKEIYREVTNDLETYSLRQLKSIQSEIKSIQQGLSMAQDRIKNNSGIENVRDKKTGKHKKVGSVFAGYKGQLVGLQKSIEEELKKIEKEGKTSIKFFEDIKASIVSIGSDIGERLGIQIGLGLQSGISNIEEIVVSVVEETKEAVEEELEIQSPSKWAKRLGILLGKGLSKGVENVDRILTTPFKEAQEEIDGITKQLQSTAIDVEAEVVLDVLPANSGSDLALNPENAGLESFPNILQQTGFDLAKLTGGFLAGSAAAAIFLPVLGKIKELLFGLGREAIQVAANFELIKASTSSIIGSASKAESIIERMRQTTRDLGISQISALKGYNELAAATRGTSLEGANTEKIATALNQAGAAYALTAEQLDGAYTAIQQIAGKGVVSAEELRGQLAERIPGAFQIAARAMKVTERELFQLMSTGNLLANDFLPALAKQLKIETFADTLAIAKTLAGELGVFENTIEDLKINIGEKLLPVAKTALKTINSTLKFISKNLDSILAVSKGISLVIMSFFAHKFLSPAFFSLIFGHLFKIYKVVATMSPLLQTIGKNLVVVSSVAKTVVATVAGGKLLATLKMASGMLAAIIKAPFQALLVLQVLNEVYKQAKVIGTVLDFKPLAQDTVWSEMAEQSKKTAEAIKKDVNNINKSLQSINFEAGSDQDILRSVEQEDWFSKLTNYAANEAPKMFLGDDTVAKRRREAINSGMPWYDSGGRFKTLGASQEDFALQDMERRFRETDNYREVDKVLNGLGQFDRGEKDSDLFKLTQIDKEIAKLTVQKSVLDPDKIGQSQQLAKAIANLEQQRDELSTAFVTFETLTRQEIKTIEGQIDAEKRKGKNADPRVINQAQVRLNQLQKELNLLSVWEGMNGPISSVKKFALALQKLEFVIDGISQASDYARTTIERAFTQKAVKNFSTGSYFADIENLLAQSQQNFSVLTKEIETSEKELMKIYNTLAANPAYVPIAEKIRKEEEKLGRYLMPADLEYLKVQMAAGEDVNKMLDAEIKLRQEGINLEEKRLEKDNQELAILQEREQLILAKLDRAKHNTDIQQQLAEAKNRSALADMGMQGNRSTEIAAIQAIFQEEAVGQRIGNLKINKSALQEAFKQGEVSAKEYQDRLQETNLELANLNAELKETKLQTQQALDARFLEHIERQMAGVNHQISLNQINREAHNLIAYQEGLSNLNSAQIELARVTRNSQAEIASLTAHLNASKQALDALTSSGSNSEEVAAKIIETKRQIETQSAELVRAQIQSAQSIEEAQDAAIIADIDKAFQNAQHQNSIVDLNQEYSKLDTQLKSLKSDDTSPLSKFNEVVAQSESNIEGLNRELKINKNLLNDLSTSGVNNPEIRDRIEEVGKQVETQEKQLAIARKQSEVDIFEARSGMLDEIAGKEEEISKKKEEDFLKQLEIQSKQFDHNATIEDLNKEYKKVQNQFENLGKESPMLDFQNAVDDSKDKVLVIKRELKQTLNTLQQLKKSPIKSETITEKIQDAEKELEVQKLKLKIAQEQSKIDISQAETALKDALSPEKLNEQNEELENIILKIQKIEEKLSLINIESEKQSVVAEKILNQYSQKLNTLSEISGLFEQINIYSENLFDIEMAMNNRKSRMELKDLKRKLVIEEDTLDINREKFLLERKQSEIESDAAIKNAEDALKEAKAGHDSNAIKNAEMALDIAKEERDILKDKRKTEDLIYSKEKEILAIRSQSEIKLKKAEMANLSYKNSLDVVAFAVKQINQQFDKQKTYIDSYKELFAAQRRFLQQVKENKLKELDFGRNIIQQLKQENISEHLKRELEAQLSALGLSRSDSEADILLEAFKIENKLAEERLEVLKQQQTIDKTLLDIDLKRAELDARSAVIQAQILGHWSKMMGVDSTGLVKEAIANLDFTRQQGELARQTQSIGQASEINQQLMDDWLRKLQRRQEIAGADGYSGGLGNIDAKPKLIKPNTKISKFNPTDYEPSEFDEEAMIPEFMKPKPEYQASDFQDKRYVPDFSPLASQVGETNSILTEMRELMKQQNNKKTDNIELTVVSSDAVVDAGKILNDITKPY